MPLIPTREAQTRHDVARHALNGNEERLAEKFRNKALEEKKKTECILKEGTVLDGHIVVGKLIGSGGFGQIYYGRRGHSNREVAVKVGLRKNRASTRMILEQRILQQMSKYKHFPEFYCSGDTEKINYLCMELLGPNVHEVRKQQPTQRLRLATALAVADQMVQALKILHRTGYLHRDVKPSNVCAGRGVNQRVIYLVDFGLARRYMTNTGDLREFRPRAGFRGTSRYVSCRVHEHKEHTVWDDLWGVLYSVVELIEGQLPWRRSNNNEQTLRLKQNFQLQSHAPNVPRRIHRLFKYVKCAEPEDLINYHKIRSYFEVVPPERDEAYEWETVDSEENTSTCDS